MSWRWINKQALLLLHDESLAEHGGRSGLRGEGLLDSALARPQHLAAYGEPDIAELAASYCIGLAKNHPFVDGNKRAAFLDVGLFLFQNSFRLTASPAEATLVMFDVASGRINETAFATWIRTHIEPRG